MKFYSGILSLVAFFCATLLLDVFLEKIELLKPHGYRYSIDELDRLKLLADSVTHTVIASAGGSDRPIGCDRAVM